MGPLSKLHLLWMSHHEDDIVWHFLKKMCRPRPLFHLFSVFLKQTSIQFCNRLMWKNVHPVYGAGIRTHDLQNRSLLPKPHLQFYILIKWPSRLLAVWPDVGIKSSPIFSKSCPKSTQCSFCIRVRFFEITQKVANHLASFACNFVAKNFKKLPNLVTLRASKYVDWKVMYEKSPKKRV